MRATGLGRLKLVGAIWLAVIGAVAGAARAQTAYLVTDLLPGEDPNGGSNPIDLMPAGKHLFFLTGPTDNGQTPQYTELWVTDGTAAGTQRLPGGAAFVASLGDLIFYGGGGSQLWRSDGTRAGTFLLTDAAGATGASAVLGGVLYYIAYNSAPSGPSEQLWRSDGTVAGTYLVADVGARLFDFHQDVLIAAGGRVFFVAPEPSPNNAWADLWSSDGTTQGTGPVTSFQQQGLDGLTAAGGRLFFFTAPAGPPNAQLWVSDGSKAGTRLVSSAPGAGWMVAAGKQAVYAAEDSAHLRQIWQSDGTPAGTRQVTSGSGFGPLVDPRCSGPGWSSSAAAICGPRPSGPPARPPASAGPAVAVHSSTTRSCPTSAAGSSSSRAAPTPAMGYGLATVLRAVPCGSRRSVLQAPAPSPSHTRPRRETPCSSRCRTPMKASTSCGAATAREPAPDASPPRRSATIPRTLPPWRC